MTREAGTPLVLRHVSADGRVWSVLPQTVVADDDRRLVSWLRPGTDMRWPVSGRWAVPEPHVWAQTQVLQITPYGAAHSVWCMWDEAFGAFLGWYVNLQEPLRPSRFGFDTLDHELDIVATPDLAWRWKDEDKLHLGIEAGVHTQADIDAARREGERVVADIEARRPPFDEPWPYWRPSPEAVSAPLPPLPPDWAD